MSMNRSGGRADFNSGVQFAGFYLPFDGRVSVRLPQAKGASNTVFTVSPRAQELPRKSARNRDRMSRQVGHFDAGPKYPPSKIENRGQADFFAGGMNSMIFPRSSAGIHLSFFRKLIGM